MSEDGVKVSFKVQPLVVWVPWSVEINGYNFIKILIWRGEPGSSPWHPRAVEGGWN
jgi:hypothetical protein